MAMAIGIWARAFAALLCTAGPAVGIAVAQPTAGSEPWRDPQDTAMALFEPDKYAWRLFVAMSWPANVAQKEADPAKTLGAVGPVVWETWRNVRPGAADTVFRRDGADPGAWLEGASPVVAREQRGFEPNPLKRERFLAMRRSPNQPGVAFDAAVQDGNEVRLNRDAYEFIRSKQLYNIDGQIAEFNRGTLNLSFPPRAKEIKAQWRQIREADKPRYHWAEVRGNDGQMQAWGLTALHISTKDLPNWFWATFEHIDNKTAGPVLGGQENVGFLTASIDRFACPTAPHNCERIPAGLGLEGTKWANYILRGTQIDFIDTIGTATILANSQIESPFQQQSSCISCHAVAARNRAGNRLGGHSPIVGSPRPEWFIDPATGQREFMQLDFVFALERASRKRPPQ